MNNTNNDIEEAKKHNVNLGTRNGHTYNMSLYELSRWCSLIEGVEVIDKKLRQLNLGGKSDIWIKPIPLQKYIDERSDDILYDLMNGNEV